MMALANSNLKSLNRHLKTLNKWARNTSRIMRRFEAKQKLVNKNALYKQKHPIKRLKGK